MRKYFNDLNAFQYDGKTKYFPALNGVKGLLILIVVLSHCLPSSMALIFFYLFDMPLFMGLSGFLLKQAAFDCGYKEYLKKIFHHLLIPWLIASVIFLPFRLTEKPLSPLSFYDIIYPYYHLWYIPAYLIGATICYFIIRFKGQFWSTFFVTLFVTIVWYIVYRFPLTSADAASVFLIKYPADIYSHSLVSFRDLPLYWLGEKRFFSYIFFFVLGFGLRNLLIINRVNLLQNIFLILISFVTFVFFIFGKFSNIISVWPYLIFNISLVIFIMIFVAPQNWFQNKYLLKTGEWTLGIYLYHPAVQKIIYFLLGDREQTHLNLLGGTGIFIVVIFFTMALIWILKQWSVTDKYMLGNINR
jgi:fucose 4-O-acetylase-like acetyltransferase